MKFLKKMLNMKTRTALLINSLAMLINLIVYSITNVESVWFIFNYQTSKA